MSLQSSRPSRRSSPPLPPGFRTLWTAAITESLGDDLVRTLLPIIAVSVLGAGAFAVGAIHALTMVSFLVLGIPVGVWVDRMRKRPVLVVANVVRAASVALIPLLAFTGTLTLWHVLAIAAVLGISDVYFTTAHSAAVPALVPRDRLSWAFARIKTVQTASSIGTPALVGLGLRLLAAPVAAIAAVVAYLVSAVVVARLHLTETSPSRTDRQPFWSSARDGLRFTVRHPALRALLLAGMATNAAAMLGNAVMVVYALDSLALSPATTASLGITGGVGGLAGALMATRVVSRLGIGRTKILTALVSAPAVAVIPLAPYLSGPPVLWVATGSACWSLLVVLSGVAGSGVIAALTPTAMLGRVHACSRVFIMGAMPVASLVGGAAATRFGVVPVLWAWVALAALATVPILASPVRSWQDVPAEIEPGGRADGEPVVRAPDPRATR